MYFLYMKVSKQFFIVLFLIDRLSDRLEGFKDKFEIFWKSLAIQHLSPSLPVL